MYNVAGGFYYRRVFEDSRLAFHLGMMNNVVWVACMYAGGLVHAFYFRFQFAFKHFPVCSKFLGWHWVDSWVPHLLPWLMLKTAFSRCCYLAGAVIFTGRPEMLTSQAINGTACVKMRPLKAW